MALWVPSLVVFLWLSTEAELLYDCSVSLDVDFLEIIQNLTTLTYKAEKRTACNHILLVLLHVLGKMSDTVGK